MKKHIFISYAWADAKDFAWQLAEDLKAAGYQVWIDKDEIRAGMDWYHKLQTALENTAIFLAVRTPAAKTEARWVPRERLFAMQAELPLIPLLAKDCPLELVFMGRDELDFRRDYPAALQKLRARLDEILRGEVPAPSRTELELRYLGWLLQEEDVLQSDHYIPLAGQSRVAEQGPELSHWIDPELLEIMGKNTPTPLKLQSYEDIFLAMLEHKQLVILGEPGGGKTTTLWDIVARCAKAAHADLEAGRAPSQAIPVFLRLSEWRGGPLAAWIQAQLGELGPYEAELRQQGRLAYLFDGLNEMNKAQQADHARQIKAWLEACQKDGAIALVTCRERDYVPPLEMAIERRLQIQALDPLRIGQFARAYLGPERGEALFWEVAGKQARDQWGHFKQKVGDWAEVFWRANELPEGVYWGYDWDMKANSHWWAWLNQRRAPRSLLTLAENPFMLKTICGVYEREGKLPPNRGDLFKSFVDLSFSNLLRPELLATGPVDTALLEAGLSDLAFQMQAKGESAAFTREQVGGYLSEDLLYAAQSANLLTLGEEIRFTHQLLQEYFAANRLKRELEKQTPAANFFPPDAWWKPTGWEETALLLAGLYNDDCSPVVDWLADAQPQLAVRCMFESGAALAENATEALRLRERWLPRLRDLARDSDAWARAAVGRALGQIDYDKIVNQRPRPLLDNRRGVGVVDGLPDIDWVTIPGGEFIYGEGQTGEKLFLPAFSIARYPITYVQFQCFAADPAVYGDPRWWEGLAADEDDKRLRDQGFKYANHPRESVNWYQAIAFCRWLSFQLWAVGTRHVVSAADYDPMNPLTWLVRLPTEQEWEKAARGPTGLIYPYGNTFDAQKGNSSETGIGMTSAVGVFPGGASPYGVEEMSGNIWEWCLNTPRGSINIDGTDVRCWRGGSWGLYTRGVRAASRYGNAPHGRDYGRGWRCVAAIFIPL